MSDPHNNVLSTEEMANIRRHLNASRLLAIQTADLAKAVRVLADTLETEALATERGLLELAIALPTFDLEA